MHRSLTAALAAALGLFLALPPRAPAEPGASPNPKVTAEAQARLDRGDPRGAAELLESALPDTAAADRPAVLELLHRAYAAAARQAEADGRADEAEAYRENLAILDHVPRPAPAPALVPAATPSAPPADPVPPESPAGASGPPVVGPAVEPGRAGVALPIVRASEPVAALEPSAAPGAVLPAPSRAAAVPEPAPVAAPANPPTPPAARPGPGPDAAAEASPIEQADEAFRAARYEEAGRVYAALERAGALPPGRRDHYAYCRAVAVVNRINARPASAREWAAIDAEIEAIRALSPRHWFTEYLRNLAAERHPAPRTGAARPRATRAGKLIVRGSSPDEPPAPLPPPGAAAPASGVAWAAQPVASANFVVRHVERHRALAEQVVRAAEAARAAQAKRWGPGVVPDSWDPRCEVVLFPTAEEFSRETMQPPDSPGFSTMGMNEGRIVLRRVHLRADHPNLVRAILPHEVTHVVLADLFPRQQVPRWADEGMAVLSEPPTEQTLRAADLDEPLKAGRLFKVSDLMVMDYPAPEHWALYYAQSVSLTRFLVEAADPATFVRLVQSAQKASVIHLFGKVDTSLPPDHPNVRAQLQEAQRLGFADALREVYAINSYDDLQARWLSYAREHATGASAVTASSTDAKPAAR